MGNALKGMIAGFVATLILSGLMLLNSTMDLMPQINIVRMLANLATLSTTAAWMDHFIVGVVIWGLLFAVYDGVATRPAHWLKGIIVGVLAWLMMMVAFMPLAGAGFLRENRDHGVGRAADLASRLWRCSRSNLRVSWRLGPG
jgi:hypothetical protein